MIREPAVTPGDLGRAALGLVVGLAAGAALAMWMLPRADLGPGVAARPGEQRVDDWEAAAVLAGVPLYAPPSEGFPALVVHGVAGDATRPVEAAFDGGLVMIEAHRDLLPTEDSGILVAASGADDAWWQEAGDGRRLAVRLGDTLALLWGRSDRELVAIASTLKRIDGRP